MEDEVIVNELYEHDENGLEHVKMKYEYLLKSISYNILLNYEDANECLNDTYLKIWKSIPPYKPTYLKTYICKLIRQISIDKYRYNHRDSRSIDNETSLSDLDFEIKALKDVDDEINEKEIKRIINDFLEDLKEEDRVLFIKKYFFLENSENLSNLFDTTVSNINMKTKRLRDKLKKRLESEGYLI